MTVGGKLELGRGIFVRFKDHGVMTPDPTCCLSSTYNRKPRGAHS
jgi:hypothetical protein